MNKKTYSKFMVSIRLMTFKSISLLLNDLSFNKWFNHLKKNKKNKKKKQRGKKSKKEFLFYGAPLQ